MYHKGFVNTVKPSHSDRHGSAASLFGDYSAPNLKSYEIVAAAFKRMNMNANTLTFNFILVRRRPCEEHEFFCNTTQFYTTSHSRRLTQPDIALICQASVIASSFVARMHRILEHLTLRLRP